MRLLFPMLFMSTVTCLGQGVSTSNFSNGIFPDNDFLPQLKNLSKRKLFQRNTGMIAGIQRGKYTNIELGAEAHWRKISLFNPRVIGATANLEYNLANNVLGYTAGVWTKKGRINLTYGGNINYFTDFNEGHRFGFGPAVGFRFFGFHVLNGYTFFTGDGEKTELPAFPANNFYMSIRYYFPVENKFTWDRQTMKKKKQRKKERARRKRERNDQPGLFQKIFRKDGK